jgi:hypothetical protein
MCNVWPDDNALPKTPPAGSALFTGLGRLESVLQIPIASILIT